MITAPLPLVITGLGRSGSSMLMQMMIAGGLRPTGSAVWPGYEDDRVCGLPNQNEWLEDLRGGDVVKVLTPNEFRLPRWFKCGFIWLDRDHQEQAKSFLKFARAVGASTAGVPLRGLRQSLRRDTTTGLAHIKEHTKHARMLRLRFEDVIHDSRIFAELIDAKFELGIDCLAAARAVVPRATRCIDTFLEHRRPP